MRFKPSVIDFFAGAGGLSLGFACAGFRVETAVDRWAAAVETHRWKLGGHAQDLDLSAGDLAFPSATVIVGGPPCQGFSSAGLRKRGDDRNTLVGRFADLVAQLRPAQAMKGLPEPYWHDSYRRLRLEEPSKAITGAARNEFVHPREDRCLTVRECARLQTFPDVF